ncbi:NADPH-dependent F420 reductase [Streptomyces sp. NPDC048603]|uniref:NADPH-dependent F420 reductase n=1 Tax=Streptomyces sp. NPDC048603 TaxID=3365577 RepID=UPI0037214184
MARIGIIGTGSMAAVLGGAWVRAGHEVFVGGRDTARAADVAGRTGAAGQGTSVQAAEYGDVVLLAVPADVAPRLAAEHAGVLAGRTVVDCTNALVPAEDGVLLTTAGGVSVARLIADAAPDAHVVKAFNLAHESVWTQSRETFEGLASGPPAVPFCTDDAGSAERIAAIIASMGCVPLPAGGLARAAYLEAAAAFAIGVWWSGGTPRNAFPDPVTGGA